MRQGGSIIPRVLRDRVGLSGASEVEVEVDGAGIRVEPVTVGGFIEEDGRLVIPTVGVRVTDDSVRELRDADQR